ncbi:MAG: EAL domain-containing protein [Ilumatobacteraceae bacterium]
MGGSTGCRVERAFTDELRVFSQPIIELSSGRSDDEELLVRLFDGDGHPIEPSVWMYLAERAGLSMPIDRFMVERAVEHLASKATGSVSVNLSGATIGNDDFHRGVERLVANASIDGERLVFEVTETAAVANIAAARVGVDRLRALGCKFALDDFGAGFSSFYYLKHLDFDVLKIDGEFVTSCAANSRDRLLIRSIVSIARELGATTVAEHVDSAAVLHEVNALGVTHAQGYHLAMPAPLRTHRQVT